MNDYARALSALKNLLPEGAIHEFELLEARMLNNLQRERLYGSTRDIDADRFAIVDVLNQLAWQYQTKSFTELCFHPQTVKVNPATASTSSMDSSATKVQQSLKKVVSPKVTVQFFTHMIPTAYYHLLSVQTFPLFNITIDNTDPDGDDASLVVRAFIEDHSNLEKATVTVMRGECKDVMLLPVLKYHALQNLTEIRKVTLHIGVRQLSPSAGDLEDNTETVYLMARNQALIAIRVKDEQIMDLTRYLVAWVTPNHPEISRVLRWAQDRHPAKELRGYQDGETTEETAESVREQARAIFVALKNDSKLAYANSALRWDIQPGWITQKVRLPGECLAQGGVANCLEGSVLFASLLELVGIEPLLVLVPGHCFVGWRIDSAIDQYEFLETTMIGTGGFDQAQEDARKRYVQAVENKDFEHELFHQFGFARLIDVVQHRRGGQSGQGIYPLE